MVRAAAFFRWTGAVADSFVAWYDEPDKSKFGAGFSVCVLSSILGRAEIQCLLMKILFAYLVAVFSPQKKWANVQESLFSIGSIIHSF